MSMMDIIAREPWLLVIAFGVLVPITAILCGAFSRYLKTRQAELETSLKMEMLQRGMSAEEIKMVLEASPAKARSTAQVER